MSPDDPRAQALARYEQAERCFLEAVAPFRRQLAEIHALFDEPRMLVRPDGSVVSLPSRLPAAAQALADTLQRSIDHIREMCLTDVVDPRFEK